MQANSALVADFFGHLSVKECAKSLTKFVSASLVEHSLASSHESCVWPSKVEAKWWWSHLSWYSFAIDDVPTKVPVGDAAIFASLNIFKVSSGYDHVPISFFRIAS